MAEGTGTTKGHRWAHWKLWRLPLRLRQTVSGFWTGAGAIIGTIAALATILAYAETQRETGFFQSNGFGTTVVRSDTMHIGNYPHVHSEEYGGREHTFYFDAPNLDTSEMAVLTFDVGDIRTKRHFELNGRLLSTEPDVRNSRHDSWNTIYIVLEKGALRSSGNELRIVSLDANGKTTGDIDDLLVRNIAVLYKSQ